MTYYLQRGLASATEFLSYANCIYSVILKLLSRLAYQRIIPKALQRFWNNFCFYARPHGLPYIFTT